MKLKNTTTEIVKDEQGAKMNYVDFCNTCLNVLPQGGLDVSEMKSRLDVKIALDKANGSIDFTTKAQVETLKNCVKSMKWAIIHSDVIDFTEAVEKL